MRTDRTALLLLLFISSIPLHIYSVDLDKKENLLILFSYSPDYQWTRDLNRGLMDRIDDDNLNISFEYMDFRNYPGEEYRSSYLQMFNRKYRDIDFDYLITADNLALEFYLTNRPDSLAGARVISTGLNGKKHPPEGGDISYIFEENSFGENITLARKLNPGKTRVMIIGDKTETSEQTISLLIDAISPYDMQIRVPDNSRYQNIIDAVRTCGDDTIIFYIMFFQDSRRTFKYNQILHIIEPLSRQPLFVLWDFFLEDGAFGGYCYSGYRLGEFTAERFNELQAGFELEPVYSPELNHYKFNYSMIKKYGIDIRNLPEDSIFINKPLTFYERHRNVLLVLGAVILILIIIIFLIILNLKKKTLLNQKSEQIMNLQQEQINSQKTLLLKLGDVIETRSEDTGNHVLRVTKIADFIGREAGLSDRQLAILDAVVPLHDIGKVAIPDTILNKPGKLSTEEFERMKLHTILGYEVLHDKNKLIDAAARIARHHHERWDGSGYPDSLKGEEISLLSRIAAVADVFDALRCRRVYKEGWSCEQTRDFIRKESGRMFDPALVKIVMENFDKLEEIRIRYNG